MDDYNLIKKETPTQAFSCEFCKNFKVAFLQNTSGQLLLNTGLLPSKYDFLSNKFFQKKYF